MIVAEFCDLIKKSSVKDQQGALPFNLGSYYNEFQIINYLGEDICALDYQNRVVRIKPQEGISTPRIDDRSIIIQYRFTSGPRKIGSMAIEQTLATHCKMVIPYSVLIEEPVFVEEINALLYCPLWHPKTNLHPHSNDYITQEHDRLRLAIGRASVYNPITIIANDPTGKIKVLYISINGEICSVKVTNFNTSENESDVVTVGIRGTVNGSIDDCKIIRTTFGRLFKEHSTCWTIGGFLVSSDRAWLINHIAIEKSKPEPNTIPIDEVKSLLSQAKASDDVVIQRLKQSEVDQEKEIRELKTKYKTLQTSYDDIVKSDYLDRSSDYAFRKIDLEETKLYTSVQESKIARQVENTKLTKETIATIATVAKTIAVLVPLVALYIKYKQAKAAAT